MREKCIEEYESIRYLKKEFERVLQKEMERILAMKDLQKSTQQWIRCANLSWTQICVAASDSSSYGFCVIDIHSISEAYIFFSKNAIKYNYLASIFDDDFGDSYSDDHRIYYACQDLLRERLPKEYPLTLQKTTHLTCCHNKKR